MGQNLKGVTGMGWVMDLLWWVWVIKIWACDTSIRGWLQFRAHQAQQVSDASNRVWEGFQLGGCVALLSLSSWLLFQGLGVPRWSVRTRHQLRWLQTSPNPHEAMWEKEATCRWGCNKQKMMIGNMANTGLRQNRSSGLHVGLVGMLVINFLFQKSHCIFFPCWFLFWCQKASGSFALEA